MKAWTIDRHGGPEQLQLVDMDAPVAQAGQAIVKICAIGLNHLDLWVRKGVPGHQFPLPMIPGSDLAGELLSFGPLSEQAKQDLKRQGVQIGSRVLINPVVGCNLCRECQGGHHQLCQRGFQLYGETTNGGCCEQKSVPIENLIPLPDRVSYTDAASLPVAYVTAWQMIRKKSNLRPGDLVLIQAGGSGVSVAAIQMAKLLGASVATTVGSDAKVAEAKKLGADWVINYKTQDLKAELKNICRESGRRGFDVVLDHIGKDTMLTSLKALAPGGRLLTCGATSGAEIEIDLKQVFFKNLSLIGSTMGSRLDLIEVLDLVSAKKLVPVIAKTFPFDQLPKAHTYLESRQAFGKLVIEVP